MYYSTFTIECDYGPGCGYSREREDPRNEACELRDAIAEGWLVDYENESAYCPKHKKEIMEEIVVECPDREIQTNGNGRHWLC